MRVVVLSLLAATLAVRPAAAGRILYATAASENRIDGFCLGTNGALDPTPSVQVATTGALPRRLVVMTGRLYVAESDRVEVFQIGSHGGLGAKPIGRTDVDGRMTPHDIVLSPDGKMLYVPHSGASRVVAYPLDDQGVPVREDDAEPKFSSCIQGLESSGYQSLALGGAPGAQQLYVCADGPDSGHIDVFPLAADGNFVSPRPECAGGTNAHVACTTDADCPEGTCLAQNLLDRSVCTTPPKKKRPAATVPTSTRDRLDRPRAFFLHEGKLYVEERGRKQISAFELGPAMCHCKDDVGCPPAPPPGNFCQPVPRHPKKKTQSACDLSADTFPPPTGCRPQRVVKPRTQRLLNYEGMVFDPVKSTIFAAQFFRGRIDAYGLDENGLLLKRPTKRSKADIRMSPVRLTGLNLEDPAATSDYNVLYVAAGEFDRVVAYRVGDLNGGAPFSMTDEQKGSFPNDVAIAVLDEGCQ